MRTTDKITTTAWGVTQKYSGSKEKNLKPVGLPRNTILRELPNPILFTVFLK